MEDKYKTHIEAIRKIFLQAITKGNLSTALRAKILEIKLEQQQSKDNKIDFTKISENELEEMIRNIESQLDVESD